MTEQQVYAVRDWPIHFENAQSRRVPRLSWVPFPNKHDGKGYRRLMNHPKSTILFSGFILIVEVASKMPTRGILFDDGRVIDSEDLSLMTGFPKEHFDLCFDVLTQEKYQWLVCDTPSALRSHYERALLEQKGREEKGKNRILKFDADAGRITGIEQSDIVRWCETYPAVDIRQQIKIAEQWLVDNPKKRKKDYKRFLSSWFGRNQERGGSVRSTQTKRDNARVVVNNG